MLLLRFNIIRKRRHSSVVQLFLLFSSSTDDKDILPLSSPLTQPRVAPLSHCRILVVVVLLLVTRPERGGDTGLTAAPAVGGGGIAALVR